MALLCFLKVRDFSSSLNDRHKKKMTGRKKTHSLLSGGKAVCVPDASCLSQQHFLFGDQQGLMRLSQLFFLAHHD